MKTFAERVAKLHAKGLVGPEYDQAYLAMVEKHNAKVSTMRVDPGVVQARQDQAALVALTDRMRAKYEARYPATDVSDAEITRLRDSYIAQGMTLEAAIERVHGQIVELRASRTAKIARKTAKAVAKAMRKDAKAKAKGAQRGGKKAADKRPPTSQDQRDQGAGYGQTNVATPAKRPDDQRNMPGAPPQRGAPAPGTQSAFDSLTVQSRDARPTVLASATRGLAYGLDEKTLRDARKVQKLMRAGADYTAAFLAVHTPKEPR